MEKKPSRREARIAAMRAIFAALAGGGGAGEAAIKIAKMSDEERAASALQDPLAADIICQFDEWRQDIDARLQNLTARPADSITLVERAIISAGLCEFFARPQTDAAVVINEAIEIAKTYGAGGGGALVHAALNAAAKQRAAAAKDIAGQK